METRDETSPGGALAAVMAANGLAMLFASMRWYLAVPGVIANRPVQRPFHSGHRRDLPGGGAGPWLVRGVARWGWPALTASAAFLVLLASLLAEDAVLISDGGGKRPRRCARSSARRGDRADQGLARRGTWWPPAR